MNRLTHKYLHGGYWASIFKVSACGENECKGEIIDRLAAYENAEEQGLIVRLPCKVGDTVYEVSRFCSMPTDCPNDCKFCSNSKLEIDKVEFNLDMLEEMGKTVFLTKEDAEKSLAERDTQNE